MFMTKFGRCAKMKTGAIVLSALALLACSGCGKAKEVETESDSAILERLSAEQGTVVCATMQAFVKDMMGSRADKLKAAPLTSKMLDQRLTEQDGRRTAEVDIQVLPFQDDKPLDFTLSYSQDTNSLWRLDGVCVLDEKKKKEEDEKKEANEKRGPGADLAKQGRELFISIYQANIERAGMNLPSVWPRPKSQISDGAAEPDISDTEFKDATSFFQKLFDMVHYGKSDWDPYVTTEPKIALIGNPPKAVWHVARGLSDEAPDLLPALVSANVDVSSLITKPGDYQQNDLSGKLRFTGDFAVIIRKSGAVLTVTANNSDLKSIYGGDFSIPASWEFGYLAP